MTVETTRYDNEERTERDFPVQPLNWGAEERTKRLKTVVRDFGGNKKVAEKSGVPLSSLNSYMNGREMSVPAMIALAEACGVPLEWLATGRGPMRAVAPVQSQSQADINTELLDIMSALDPEYFRDAIKMVEQHAQKQDITLASSEKNALVARTYSEIMTTIARLDEGLSNLQAALPTLPKDRK